MLSEQEAKCLASRVRDALPMRLRQKLKSIWVMPHLHSGHTTIRVFAVPSIAEDPETFVFKAEEL